MGISSDGMLFFGFPVGAEEEPPEWMEGFDEFSDFLAAKAGLPDDIGWKEKRELEKTCPVELQMYCSYDYPMHLICIRGAQYRVHRGYLTEVDPRDMAVEQSKIDAAKSWCGSSGIEWKEPKWLLCSMYG